MFFDGRLELPNPKKNVEKDSQSAGSQRKTHTQNQTYHYENFQSKRENKSEEHGKNLSSSWHEGHSHAYNTQIQLSRLQMI